jgi:hypothetical protein
MNTTTIEAAKIIFILENKELCFRNYVSSSNWAFIDMQNVIKAVERSENGWPIDWRKFRQILLQEYQVSKAVAFMGFIMENVPIYYRLQTAGFEIQFRTVKREKGGKIMGGNIDVDLASYAMDHKNEYNKAIICANDGDYCQFIKSLNLQNKLKLIISPHNLEGTSGLIKEAVSGEQIISIHSIRNLIEYKK